MIPEQQVHFPHLWLLVSILIIFVINDFNLVQERLKKIKSEYGKVQLGNITVDMVSKLLLLCCFPFSFQFLVVFNIYLRFCYTFEGNWWHARNDRSALGNIVTWPRWGINSGPLWELLQLFKMQNISNGFLFLLIREFASGVYLYLNVRRYYQQQSLVVSHCLRVFFGFFWPER